MEPNDAGANGSSQSLVPAPQPDEVVSNSTGGLVAQPATPPATAEPSARRSPNRPAANLSWLFHRVEVGVVLCGLIVAALFVPQVKSFGRRNEAKRGAADGPPYWQALEALEFNLYDARFAARGPQQPKSYHQIAIVGVDQESMNEMGQWPWPRSWHAELVTRLKKAGARVIALDFDFSDHQNPHPNGSLSDADKKLIAALKAAGNVVLPSPLTPSFKGGAETFITSTPFDELDMETVDPCISYVPPDSDEGVRRYPLRSLLSGSDIGSLGVLAAGMYQGLVARDNTDKFYSLLKRGVWPTMDGPEVKVPTTLTRLGSGDVAPQIWNTRLNFWGPPGTFNTYSYSDVLKGASRGFGDARMREAFAGRIVFVGATAHELKDVFRAPKFGVAKIGDMARTEMAGVELHATAAAMFLDGAYIDTVSTTTTLMTLFGLTVGSALWLALLSSPLNKAAREMQLRYARLRLQGRKLPGRIQFLLWFLLYVTLGSLPLLIFWQVAQWMFVHRNLWVIVTYPMLSAIVCSSISLLLLFSSELVQSTKVKTQMGRFMSAPILEEVLAHPQEDYPRPRRVHATVLFTDLEGFTTYSESHEAEEVIAALNLYMTYMMPIIERYDGTFDKYIGDAIMCYFGAPIPYFNHATRGLLCAIEMQEACAKFRADHGIPFYMRIGVHTGDVIAGSMGSGGGNGSEPALNYTVIGDTVNVASRLEGKNKDFQSWIMCSAETYEAAPDVVEVERAVAQVKGKARAVEVYIVKGLQGVPDGDKNWGRALGSGEREQLLSGSSGASAEPPALESPTLALPSPSSAAEPGSP